MAIPRLVMSADAFKVSPPGVNALTASSDQLLLDFSVNRAQLVGVGVVTPPNTVPISGFSVAPLAIIGLAQSFLWNVSIGSVPVYLRPSPMAYQESLNAQATISSTSLVISGGGGLQVWYHLYRQRI